MKTSKKLFPTLDIGSHINARGQTRQRAGARHERRLLAVGCRPLILIEAPSPAYRRGMLRGAKNLVTNTAETSRRFSTTQHPLYCGIDLHARRMDGCILDQAGALLGHRNLTATPEALRKAMAPDREQIVLAAAWMCPWYGLADCGAAHGRPFVLGPALSLQAIHGGTAKNAPIDAQTIAVLWRGGMLPQASVSPAERRATRDRRRRRLPLARPRGALLAPVHKTHSPSTLPALGKNIASKAHRDGVAERCAEPAVHKSLALDLALRTSEDARRRAVARTLGTTAQPHDANTLSLLQTVPGIGTILRLVLLDDIQDRARFPRGQEFAAYGRLVTCAKASAGTRAGTSGATRGNAPRTGAFSAAAVFC